MKLLVGFFSMFFVIFAQAGSYGGRLNLASGTASTSYKDLSGKSVVLLSGPATLDVKVRFIGGRRVLTFTDSKGNKLSLPVRVPTAKDELDINLNLPNLKATTSQVSRVLNKKYERPGRIEEEYGCLTFGTDADGNTTVTPDVCYRRYPSIDLVQDSDVQYTFSFIINGQPLEFIHSKTTTKIFSQRKVQK